MGSTHLPTFSASDRIKQLNKIDKDVAKLLESAGLAIKALTKPTANAPVEGQPSQPRIPEQHRDSFTAATSQYFTLLSSVDVSIRRQIYALEEAEILPAEAVIKEPPSSLALPSAAHASPPNSSLSRTLAGNKGVTTGGGLGNLDVGWLNSRNDNVGKEMKSEMWEEADKFVHMLEKSKAGADGGLGSLHDRGEEEAADSLQQLNG